MTDQQTILDDENADGQVQVTNVLQLMAGEVAQWCEAKGWAKDGRTFGDEIALIHSELSEALEAFRTDDFTRWVSGGPTDDQRIIPGSQYPANRKPEGVPSELADVLVRLLDTCQRHDIDLFGEFRAKMNYNWTRTHRHGGKRL